LHPAPPVTDVVICADDYAMTPEISSGIIALAEQGRISATSAMTLSPHWPQWAGQVPALQQRIDVGLHLDWTSDFALQQGFGKPLGSLMVRSLLGRLRKAEVAAQIQRQLDLFEQHAGTPPDHIDGHQHVHQFPILREVLVDILVQRYAPEHRPWLRVAHVVCPPWELKARIINAMGAGALRTLAERRGIPHSEHLTGVYDFQGDTASYRQRLQGWLGQLPPGTVLMCHPADGINAQAPFPDARIREQAVLSHTALNALLQEQRVRIVRGSQLFTSPPPP
jgi:chitin disaccharide deacetylase